MKKSSIVVFISIVLVIYSAIHYGIYGNLVFVFSETAALIITISAGSLFWIARVLEHRYPSPLSAIFTWGGGLWFAMINYLTFGYFLQWLLWLILSSFTDINGDTYYQTGGLIILILSVIIVTAGFFNAKYVIVKDITPLIKPAEKNRIRITMFSDLHAGTITARKRIREIVKKINDTNPDIILVPGDIVNEDIDYCIKYDCAAPIRELKAPLGVYGVTGNHEYIAGIKKAKDYIATLGIKLLEDEYVIVDNKFLLAGREDRSSSQFSGYGRKKLETILEGAPGDLPRILMDHQPFALEKGVENGFLMQLSGHTHHGQLVPLNLITKMVYEVSTGYKKKNNTHIYVSSGAGTWGPPVRTGSRCEIVTFEISLDEKEE